MLVSVGWDGSTGGVKLRKSWVERGWAKLGGVG